MSNASEVQRLRRIEALGWLKRAITEGIRAGGWQPAETEQRMERIAALYSVDLRASVSARRENVRASSWELVFNMS